MEERRSCLPEDPVALQGTIDTFDLTEVMRMLASGEKTGRLGLDGDRGSGSIWFSDGKLVSSDTDASALADDHAAVLFQLLRFTEGSFVFDQDRETDAAGEPVDAEPVIDEAVRQLAEWREIEAVVPSLHHHVRLSAELSNSEVVIDQDRWRAVAAIGGGSAVGQLGSHIEQGELDVSRTVKALVELGIAEVSEPPAGGVEPAAELVAEAPAPPVEMAVPEIPDTLEIPEANGAAAPEGKVPQLDEFSLPDPLGDGSDEPGSDPDWQDDPGRDGLAEVPYTPDNMVVDEVGAESTDGTARSRLDALASGFGLTDESTAVDAAAPPPPPVEPMAGTFGPEDFAEPEPLPGAIEDGAGSFPIEAAEAAGEATTPLFAHDGESLSVTAEDASTMPHPGEAAEVARQLNNLSPQAAKAVAAAARATTDEERDAALALVAEGEDEPLDPELLRSFLSSVRQ